MSDTERTSDAPETTTAGAYLRASREAAGLSVDVVAQQLKLAPRQVRAIEEDDYARLPGRTFVRGFVRNYARLLGIEAERARVVAHESAHERAAGQLRVVVLLERAHLARRELQLLRDAVLGQPRGLARRAQPRADGRLARTHRVRIGVQPQSPESIWRVSGESG